MSEGTWIHSLGLILVRHVRLSRRFQQSIGESAMEIHRQCLERLSCAKIQACGHDLHGTDGEGPIASLSVLMKVVTISTTCVVEELAS